MLINEFWRWCSCSTLFSKKGWRWWPQRIKIDHSAVSLHKYTFQIYRCTSAPIYTSRELMLLSKSMGILSTREPFLGLVPPMDCRCEPEPSELRPAADIPPRENLRGEVSESLNDVFSVSMWSLAESCWNSGISLAGPPTNSVSRSSRLLSPCEEADAVMVW